MIGVDKALCGLEKHVAWAPKLGSRVQLVDDLPLCWVGATPDRADPGCLRTLFELEAKPFAVDPPGRFAAMASFLGKEDPWGHVHPTRRAWWAAAKAKEAWGLFKACDVRYHRQVFAPCSALFAELKPWRVDPSVKDSTDLNAATCVSEDGWLSPPTYNRFGTRTGRLTVTDGPRVLTVRHDTRGLFRPVDGDHELVQFDFSALEARVALSLAGRSVAVEEDPYLVIAGLMGSKERDEAKSATFAALYSDPTAKTQKDPRTSKVRRIFKLGETFAKLKESKESGQVRNFYGRVIPDTIDETLYNNYVQSTGADVVLLGFARLMPALLGLGCVPHFFLHDALFCSVPKAALAEASETASKGVSVQGFELLFPIKASTVGERPTV